MSDETGPDYVPPTFPSQPASPSYPAFPAAPGSSYGSQPPAPVPDYFGSVLPTGGNAASGDLLTSGNIERTRRNVPAIVLSLVAVLAVIGAGVFYVDHHKKVVSSAGQPEHWAPANSIAFFKADLDPANGDKTAALTFEQTFPDAPKVADPGDLKDVLLAAMLDHQDAAISAKSVDYASDIKPWLGSSAAVAVFVDADQHAQSIGILQVTDPVKAKTSLAKLATTNSDGSRGGYAVEGDYAVIGDTQAIVDAAVASARNSDIDANATYAADVATLKGVQLVTGWADLKALSNMAAKSEDFSGLSNSGMLPLGGLDSLSAVKGRAVVGLRIEPTAAVFEGRLFGQDLSSFTNGSAGGTLGELPSGSVGGFAVSGLSDALKKELAVLDKSPLTAAAVKTQMAKIGAQYGINLPDDALNMLGNQFAIGLDAVPPTGGDPSATKITAITGPTDPATGLVTAKILAGLVSQTGFPLTATAKGSQIVFTNDSGAAGSLADSPKYQAAMAGMPAKTLFAGYVNVGMIVDAQAGGVPPDAKHIDSVGTYEGIDGADLVLGARLTLR
jgi:hypothetical protein